MIPDSTSGGGIGSDSGPSPESNGAPTDAVSPADFEDRPDGEAHAVAGEDDESESADNSDTS